MNGIVEGMAMAAMGFGIIALAVACMALIKVIAMEKSTHRVTFFDPATQEFTALTDEQKKALSESPFDNL